MHPLLRELLDSRAAPPPDFDLFERTRPSSTWIVASAIARLPQEKPAKLDQDEEEEDEEGSDAEYDVSLLPTII